MNERQKQNKTKFETIFNYKKIYFNNKKIVSFIDKIKN
jgi:hypothetical protein